MAMIVNERCKKALVNAFDTYQSEQLRNSSGYTRRLEDNFLSGVNLEMFESDFAEGSGGELIEKPSELPKMQAIHSSSALVANNFALWKEKPRDLYLCGVTGFRNLLFEAKCSMGLRGTPPNLDVLLEKDDDIVAIESKFLEYLSSRPAEFSPAYDTIKDERANTSWYGQIAILRNEPTKYRFLNASQLVKHYLGLSHTYHGRCVKLLYLYWEPVNGTDFDEFRRHREEIQIFQESVVEDQLQFVALSYFDLWEQWEDLVQPDWLVGHLENLKRRYRVAI